MGYCLQCWVSVYEIRNSGLVFIIGSVSLYIVSPTPALSDMGLLTSLVIIKWDVGVMVTASSVTMLCVMSYFLLPNLLLLPLYERPRG